MELVPGIRPCRQPTQCCRLGDIDNYHPVALLLRCSRHSQNILQDELTGIVGLPLHLLLIRDHINVDWHTQLAPTSTVCGSWPLANIICNLQEDDMSLL